MTSSVRVVMESSFRIRRRKEREGERGEERERGDWEREREREGRERRRERDTKPKNAFIITNKKRTNNILDNKIISWIISQKHPTPSLEFGIRAMAAEKEKDKEKWKALVATPHAQQAIWVRIWLTYFMFAMI